MPNHDRKKLAGEIQTARGGKRPKPKHGRVTVSQRQKALIRAKHLDQQFSPGARGDKNRFRRLIMKSPNPMASIEQAEHMMERGLKRGK